MNSVAIGRHIVQNFLLGLPQIKTLAMRWHSMGMGRSEEKIRPVFKELIAMLGRAGISLPGQTILELGPGQTPDLMVGGLLLGASRAIGLDVSEYLPRGFRETSSYNDLQKWLGSAVEEGELGEDVRFDNRLLDGTAIPNSLLNMRFYDGRRFPIEDESVDIVWSNCVLEHVSDHKAVFDEVWRVLRPGGVAVHIIHLQDHHTFTGDEDWLRFLQFSGAQWERMFSNRSTWCNRLRSGQWANLCEAKAWEIVEFEELRQQLHADFDRKKLASPFNSMSDLELSVSWLNVALRKPVLEPAERDESPTASREPQTTLVSD